MEKHYNETRKFTLVSFNEKKDAELLAWVQDKKFSVYLKKLIREHMKKCKQQHTNT